MKKKTTFKIKLIFLVSLLFFFISFTVADTPLGNFSIVEGSETLTINKLTGLEKYLLSSHQFSIDSTNVYINLTVNVTVFNWMKDAYQYPTIQKCLQAEPIIQEDYPNFDCYNQDHQNLLLSKLGNFSTKGWKVLTDGGDRGYVNIFGNKVDITIPKTWISKHDLIELGEDSLVYEYQNLSMWTYKFPFGGEANITIRCEDVAVSDLWIKPYEDKLKYGANGTFSGLKRCTFQINSTNELKNIGVSPFVENGLPQYMGKSISYEIEEYETTCAINPVCTGEEPELVCTYDYEPCTKERTNEIITERYSTPERYHFNFGDVASRAFNCSTHFDVESQMNITICNQSAQPTYNYTSTIVGTEIINNQTVNITHYNYKMDFYSDKDIDPIITVTPSDAFTEVINVNTRVELGKNNFTHLEIDDSQADPPYDSLVGYWNFDGDLANTTGTTAFDFSKENNDGTYVGDAFSNETGCLAGYGKCGSFDGISDYVDVGEGDYIEGKYEFSVTAWAKMTTKQATASGNNGIVCQHDGGDAVFQMRRYTNEKTAFNVYNATDIAITTSVQTGTDWQHIVGTYNGTEGKVRLYIDGVLESEGDLSNVTQTSTDNVRIGTLGSYNFNGSIDEVMIFNTSLNSSQILAIYNNQSSRYKTSGTQEQKAFNISQGSNRVNVSTELQSNFGTNISARLGMWNVSKGYNDTLSLSGFNLGLVGYWHMDNRSSEGENDTHVKDFSGMGNNGTFQATSSDYNNGPTENGYWDSAFMFNGTGGYVNVTIGEDKNTTSLWYKNSSATSWTYAARNGTTFFVDGIVGMPHQYPINISGNNLRIGINFSGSQFFNGTIDEVMIFNRSLSASEINELYIKGRALFNFTDPQNLTSGVNQTFTIDANSSMILPEFGLQANWSDPFYSPLLIGSQVYEDYFVSAVAGAVTTRNASQELTVNLDNARDVSRIRNPNLKLVINNAVRRIVDYLRVISQRLTINNAVSKAYLTFRTISDKLTINNAVSKVYIAFRTISDKLNINNAVKRIVDYTRSISQKITINLSVAKGAVGKLIRTISQKLSIHNSVRRIVDYTRLISDKLTINNAVSKIRTTFKSISDKLTINNAVSKAYLTFRTISDKLTIHNSVKRIVDYTRSISDKLTINNAVSKAYLTFRTISDKLTINLSSIGSSAGKLIRTISDKLTINNAVRRIYQATRSISARLTINNAVRRIGLFTRSVSQIIKVILTAIFPTAAPVVGGGGGEGAELNVSVIICEEVYKGIEEYGVDRIMISHVVENVEERTGKDESYSRVNTHKIRFQDICSDLINRTLEPELVCDKIFFFILENNYEYNESEFEELRSEINKKVMVSKPLLEYYIDNHKERCSDKGLSEKLINKPILVILGKPPSIPPCSIKTNWDFFDWNLKLRFPKINSSEQDENLEENLNINAGGKLIFPVVRIASLGNLTCSQVELWRWWIAIEEEKGEFFIVGIKLWYLIIPAIILLLIVIVRLSLELKRKNS